MSSSSIILWWSGGITSAVACKIAIGLYGKENCRSIFIDTKNEHLDTYRFKDDCEKWYGIEIETITALGGKFKTIEDVWMHYLSLNVATGAICSATLKRDVRLKWQKENDYSYQVFGYDIDEPKRAKSMTLNYPEAKAVYPLLLHGMSKIMSIEFAQNEGIKPPIAYELGYNNNNCLGEYFGCISGGIGYWQKIGREKPKAFDERARIEHKLTDLKGVPVTMLKDQSNEAKAIVKETGDKTRQLVFLKPHSDYSLIKDISMMEGREPKPLMDCNGLGCAINDLQPINDTDKEINFQVELF